MQEFKVGTEVRLNLEESMRLHGASGIIKEITQNEGVSIYKIGTLAAATGEFRALEQELIIDSKNTNGHSEYSGSVCDICGSVRMLRTGMCTTCQDCGANSGCG